jgi:RNA polymerase sigma factor (sigma-70 family)
MTTPPDADAIRRSVAEPAQFGLVFDRHFQAVYAYAVRRVGEAVAEEVAAETFLRAFERRERYDAEREDALPWLLGIATNVMRRHWRSERRRLAAYARTGIARPGEVPEVAGEVLAAVAALPRRQREVLLLWAWADLSYQDIAVALALPVGTVRSRLARARGRIAGESPPGVMTDAKEASHA